MSTIKRSRPGQPEAASLPASKKQKLADPKPGLAFLVDEEARKGRKLDAKLTNGIQSTKATRVDESHAVVSAGPQQGEQSETNNTGEAIVISSAEEDSSEFDDDFEDEQEEDGLADTVEDINEAALTNGHGPEAMEDVIEEDAASEDHNDEENTEPSFGDMLLAKYPEPIDVQASFADPSNPRTLGSSGGERHLAAPSSSSMSTVLTQALKTNDRQLLESCFQVTDENTIRSTIQRLPSQHVATLMQRIAERIYRAPGRISTLMRWIQWSLVAHGIYLSDQPETMRKLKSLTQVMRDRASGLTSLIQLKGKLDMLAAQMELRNSMMVTPRSSSDDGDAEAVFYVEADDDAERSADRVAGSAIEGQKKLRRHRATSESDGSEPDVNSDYDLANGLIGESDSDDDGHDDNDDLIDIEAEDTSDDEGDATSDAEADSQIEDEESDDDVSEDDDDDDEEQAVVKQPRPQALNRKR